MSLPNSQTLLWLSADRFDLACFQFLCILGNHLQKVLLRINTDGKSLICISKNRIRPNCTCGTPESTVTRSDCIPSITTCYLCCIRKLESMFKF